MRTIKFRGKHIDNGGWVYGNFVEKTRWDLHKDYFITWNKLTKNPNDSLTDSEYIEEQVDHYTIGQFTGLTDKNGKEIYEGDIVQVKSLKGVVTWHPEGYFCIHTQKCDIAETSYNAIGDLVDWLHREYYAEGLEIIGNIHDKELMEGDEK